MRAGADAEVIAELPVVDVVPAAVTGTRERRSLVVLVSASGQRLLDGELHIGAGIVLGKLRRPAVEGSVGLYRQLVGGNMRHAAGERPADVGARHVDRLRRQAVHQVEIYVVEARECGFHTAPGFGRGVDASERLEHRIVEALHAKRNAVHPRVAKATEARRLDGAGIGLERDFGDRLERQPRAHAAEQRVDRFRREQARRTAADEHADKPPAPHGGQRALEVGEQLGDVLGFRERSVALVGIEVAIRALAHAPRDVHVERERRQQRKRYLLRALKRDLRHTGARAACAARARDG